MNVIFILMNVNYIVIYLIEYQLRTKQLKPNLMSTINDILPVTWLYHKQTTVFLLSLIMYKLYTIFFDEIRYDLKIVNIVIH